MDTETGFVKVRKVLCVQDCGLVVDKLTCETQIQGGIIMGLGYALYEERVMDSTTGVVLNPNFETYKLPSFTDIPEDRSHANGNARARRHWCGRTVHDSDRLRTNMF